MPENLYFLFVEFTIPKRTRKKAGGLRFRRCRAEGEFNKRADSLEGEAIGTSLPIGLKLSGYSQAWDVRASNQR